MYEYKHVVVLGVDGAGSYFKAAETPNIDRIFESGAITYDMRVTSFTSSCPSWMSCLHGVNPEHHGMVENYFVEYFTYKPSEVKYPSFLRVVKEARPEAEVAAIYNWIGINGIVEEDAGITKCKFHDSKLCDFLVDDYLENNDVTVLYVHFGSPDSMGHMHGYGTPEHLNQINVIDGYVGRIFDKLTEKGIIDDTLFIVTSDHGGTPEKRHGGLSDGEKFAMFAARGKTVEKRGVPFDMEIRDTAAVVLFALGIEIPKCYTARVPTGLFYGVSAKSRPVVYDPELKRCHITEPARDLLSFAKEQLGGAPLTYIAFDDNTVGEATVHGRVKFIDGYFGRAVNLDDGYLTLDNFSPAGSFTLSMWIKTQSPYLDAPLLSTKPCEDFTEVERENLTDGLTVNMWRNTYVCPAIRTSQVCLTVGQRPFTMEAELPSDYMYGWMHFALTVNRETGVITTYHDFKRVASTLAWYLKKDFPIAREGEGLAIGQDTTGKYPFKFNLELDEFAVFNSALTEEEIAALGEFYKSSQN